MTIHVLGNAVIDVLFAVERFPRPGETILARGRMVDLGGKGANQAVVAARFGAPVRLAAPIGRDPEGDRVLAALETEGLASDAITRVDPPTDQSIIYVDAGGENCIVSSHAAAASATPHWAEEALGLARTGDLLLLQGNLAFETTLAAAERGHRLGLSVMVNPAPIQYGWDPILALADLAIVNQVEAVALGGLPDPVAAARQLLSRGARRVVVTLGASGAVALDGDGETHVPAPPVRVVDTAGAGDTICGGLAAGLAFDLPLATALRLAVAAAALTVGRRGTRSAFPTRHEARALLASTRIAEGYPA